MGTRARKGREMTLEQIKKLLKYEIEAVKDDYEAKDYDYGWADGLSFALDALSDLYKEES